MEACLAVRCQVNHWKAVNCGLNCGCVCGWDKLEALQGLKLQLPLLCYALYDLCGKGAVAKPYKAFVLQEYIDHNLCRFPACYVLSCMLDIMKGSS